MLTFGQFDNRKGATWHCIVGRNFGSFVTHGMIISSACYGLLADSKFRNKAFHILLSRSLCNLTVQDSVRWMNLGKKDISVESKVMGVRRNLCLFAFVFDHLSFMAMKDEKYMLCDQKISKQVTVFCDYVGI